MATDGEVLLGRYAVREAARLGQGPLIPTSQLSAELGVFKGRQTILKYY